MDYGQLGTKEEFVRFWKVRVRVRLELLIVDWREIEKVGLRKQITAQYGKIYVDVSAVQR